MRQTLKPLCWVMMFLILFTALSYFPVWIFCPEFMLIPFASMIVVSILFLAINDNNLYKIEVRLAEISKSMESNEQYALKIALILKQYIKSYKRLMKLKDECEAQIDKHERKFDKLSRKTVDILIFIPLGALIASLYSGVDIVIGAIGSLIFIGSVILVILKIIKIVDYRISRNNKDRYLLDVINELDYCEDIISEHFKDKLSESK